MSLIQALFPVCFHLFGMKQLSGADAGRPFVSPLANEALWQHIISPAPPAAAVHTHTNQVFE